MALKRIQDLDPAVALDGTELLELEQGGASVQCTTQNIADLAAAPDAADVAFDNAASGLTATDVQAAIDELAAGSGGSAAWGAITGTLSDQTDLQAALDAKAGAAYIVVTEASAFTADPGTHDGMTRYIRAGGNVTFDSDEPYIAGMVFNIRATASISLVGDGVTLTPPAGGTLDLESAMAVQVVMTSATAGDVIGQTVAA